MKLWIVPRSHRGPSSSPSIPQSIDERSAFVIRRQRKPLSASTSPSETAPSLSLSSPLSLAWFLISKSPCVEITVTPCFTCVERDYSTKQSTRSNCVEIIPPRQSNLQLRSKFAYLGVTSVLSLRLCSSSSNHGDDVSASSSSGPNVSDTSGFDGSDSIHKAKESMTPQNSFLRDVIRDVIHIFKVSFRLYWALFRKIFKRFHKFSMQWPGARIPMGSLWAPVPYEKSFWGALERPMSYLITFRGMKVAPTTIAPEFLITTRKCAAVLSLVWFFHRWKTSVIARALAMKSVERVNPDKLLILDKIFSLGLFVLGGMDLAKACGVTVQSILTVGGIGGVATAFVARDILDNVLSGLSLQLSQPFSVGDTIKAGSMEGQVVEMELTTTSLLSAENFPIIVSNSLFSSQAIVNKSQAGWRAMVLKISLEMDDFDKIPQILEEIKNMMKSNVNVFLKKEQPYCYLSRVERSFAELSLGCNLKQMSKEKLFAAEQDVLLQSVQIIKQHGVTLASTLQM